MSEPITMIVVHHSASAQTTTLEDIRSWHIARCFSDIGYHFVIEHDGRVRHGRPVSQMGAHAKGANRGSLGVCVVGDNTSPLKAWNEQQKLSLARLVDALRLVYDIPLELVKGHREVGTTKTECPGITGEALREMLA